MFWEQESLAGVPEVRIAEVIRVSFISSYMEIRYLDDASDQVVAAEAYYSPAYSGACITSAMIFSPGYYVCVVVTGGVPFVVARLDQSPGMPTQETGKLFYDMDMQFEVTELAGALKVAQFTYEDNAENSVLYYVAGDESGGTFYKFYAYNYFGAVAFEGSYQTYQDLYGVAGYFITNNYNPVSDIQAYSLLYPLKVWVAQGMLLLQDYVTVFRSYRSGIPFNTGDARETLSSRGGVTVDGNGNYISDGTGDVHIFVRPAKGVAYTQETFGTYVARRLQDLYNDILYIERPYFPGYSAKFNTIPPIIFSKPTSSAITFGFIECRKDGALDYNKYYKTLGTIDVTWRDRETEDPRILDGVYDADYAQTEFSPIYPLEITDVEGSPTIRTIKDDRRVRPGYPAGGPERLVILDDGVNQMTKRPDFLHVQHGDHDSAPSYIDSKIHWDFYINDTFMFTMKSQYVGSSGGFNHTGELWYIHHLDLINKLIYAEVHYYEKTETGVDSFCTIKGIVIDAEGQNVIWEVEKTSVSTGTSYNVRPWMQDPNFPAVLSAGSMVPIYRNELYFRFPYNAISSASTAQYQTVLGYYYPSVDTEDAYSMMMMSGEHYINPYRYSAPRCAFQVGRNGGWSGSVVDVLSPGYDHYNPYSTRDDPYDDPVGAPAYIISYIIKPRSGATVQKWSTFAATATDPVLINMLTPPVARAAE